MSTQSSIESTLASIRASVFRQRNGATQAQAQAITNCQRALANMAAYRTKKAVRIAKRTLEITFIDREHLMIMASNAPTQKARDAAKRLLDRDPPRITAGEKRKFKL